MTTKKQSSESYFASRYLKTLRKNISQSLQLCPNKFENIVKISHSMTELTQGFWFNYFQLLDDNIQDVQIDESLRPKILEAISYSDPIHLGLPAVSNEINNFVKELFSSTYTGAARTLRTVLETAVLTTVLCIDPNRLTAKDILGGLLSGKLSEKQIRMKAPGPALIELLLARKKFHTLVKKLGTRFNKNFKYEINQLYLQLSSFAHFTIDTYGETIRKFKDRQIISESIIEQLYSQYLSVIDFTFLLFMQAETYYLGYEDANGRLDNYRLISKIGKYIPGGNIILVIDAIKEKESATRNIEYFKHSYPVIKDFMKTLKRNK